jgi:hypothetical protein
MAAGYYKAQGHTLRAGDYIRDHGTWLRLASPKTDDHRIGTHWLAVTKTGGRRNLLVYADRSYQAYLQPR